MTEQAGMEKKYWFLIFIILGIVGLWLFTFYSLVGDAERGTFGDMFGGLNALFSGLAFVGVVFAIMLQSQELRLQREELEATRRELEAQKEQLEAQNVTFQKQNFENTFFELLKTQNNILNAISYSGSSGRLAFSRLYAALKQLWVREASESGRVSDTVNMFYKGEDSITGHYFRNLYHIIKFVDQSNMKDKRFYTNLIRAQLSNQELLCLFYNCLGDKGSKKFKPLIEKYALLKTIDIEKLLDKEKHPSLYADGAGHK